jgi:hypothetical protein
MKRPFGLVVVALALALGIAAPSTHGADVNDPSRPNAVDDALRFRAEHGLSTDTSLVSALLAAAPDPEQLTYGTPLTSAEDALMQARDVAAEKLGALRAYGAAHPEEFSGLWITYPEGGSPDNAFTVNVGFTGHVAEHAAAVAALVPANTTPRVVQAANRLDEMSALHELIGHDQAFLGSIGTTLYSIETDIPDNQVIVSLSATDSTIAAKLSDRYGPAVRTVEGSQVQPDVCTRLDCGPPWKGGIKIARTNPTGYCTSGYVVRKLVGSSYVYAIWTAGHCTSATWHEGSTSGTTIGTTSAVYFANGGNTDIQVIPISASNKSNLIIDDTSSCTNCTLRTMANGQQGLNEDNYGDTVCNEGYHTGRTCGVIRSTDYTFNWVDEGKTLYHFGRATYARQGGDSGGPVWTTVGSKAAGSHTHFVTISGTDYPVYPHVYWMTQYSGYSVNPS